MSTFWKYTITIFSSLSALFGVYLLSFSYPYLALGIYLAWAGISIFSINLENKIDTELRESLEELEEYKNYLEILSTQMLIKLQKIDSTITPETILKEFFNNAKKDNEKM